MNFSLAAGAPTNCFSKGPLHVMALLMLVDGAFLARAPANARRFQCKQGRSLRGARLSDKQAPHGFHGSITSAHANDAIWLLFGRASLFMVIIVRHWQPKSSQPTNSRQTSACKALFVVSLSLSLALFPRPIQLSLLLSAGDQTCRLQTSGCFCELPPCTLSI